MSHWKIGVKILCMVLKRGSIFYGSLKNRGQNSIFFSWNPWSKFYVPWKGGSKFYIFSQCLEKGGSKPRSLPTNFTEGVPPPGTKSVFISFVLFSPCSWGPRTSGFRGICSSVDQIPRYDTKCEYVFNNLQNNSACLMGHPLKIPQNWYEKL